MVVGVLSAVPNGVWSSDVPHYLPAHMMGGLQHAVED